MNFDDYFKNSPLTTNSPLRKDWMDNNSADSNFAVVPYITFADKNVKNIPLLQKTPVKFVLVAHSSQSDKGDFDVKLNKNSNLKFSKMEWKALRNGNILETDVTALEPQTIQLQFTINGNYSSSLIIPSSLSNCFCNRNFVNDEFKNIIISLRKKDNYPYKIDDLFDIRYKNESIENPTWEDLSDNINGMFSNSNFKILKCIQKIHFIAQAFHESRSFRATYEGRSRENIPDTYLGGFDFQGRGIKQITGDENYLRYYDYKHETNHLKSRIKYKKKSTDDKVISESVTDYLKRNPEFAKVFKEKFLSKLSSDMYTVCDSAGWYWSIYKNINPYAENDDVENVSSIVNRGSPKKKAEGIVKRKAYTEWLKKIMNYDSCINKNRKK